MNKPLKKFNVHLFPVVRVKISDIEAASQTEAIEKARELRDLETLSELDPDVTYADEISHFLVDEQGDDEHEHSQFYEADGETLMTPGVKPRIVVTVSGGMLRRISTSSPAFEAVLLDYDVDGVEPEKLRKSPCGRNCLCHPFEVDRDPEYVEQAFASLEEGLPDLEAALRRIRDILYLDIDAGGREFVNPDKTWDADTLEMVAEVIRQTIPVNSPEKADVKDHT